MAYDLAADLASAKAQTTAIYGDQYAPRPAAPAPTPTPTQAVVTSTPVRDQVTSLYDNINKMQQTNPTPGLVYNGQQYNDPMALIDAQRSALEQRRSQEVARIGAEFDAAKVGQAQAQRGETGTSSMGLARIGGFDSASGQAVLTNLQRVHESEQQALLQKRQAAIQQANNAASDKDFALAQMQLDKAKEAEQLIYDRQKDFVNLTLQVKGEQRADLQQQYNMERDKVADQRWAMQWVSDNGISANFFLVGQTAFDSSTGEALTLEQYQERTGQKVGAPSEQTDFSKIQRLDQAQEAKFIKDAERQAVASMQGKYVDAGILLTDTLAQAEAKLKGSRIYQEQVRPPSSGGGGGGSNKFADVLIAGKTALDQERQNSTDTYANPDTYRDLKAAYVAKNGTPADFFQMFPPEVYISPSNRKGDLDVYKSSANSEDEQLQEFMKSFINQPTNPNG